MLIFLLAAATSGVLLTSYRDALRQQETNLRNLSIAFAAQTQSVAQAVDQLMRQVEHGASTAPGTSAVAALDNLEESSAAQEYLLGIHVFDQAGRLVATGRPRGAGAAVNPAQGAPRAPAVDDSGKLAITIGAVDPVSGRGVINFSRATLDAAGKRSGSIVAQADTDRLERIYSSVELGPGGSVTLLHRDGTMLVRGPKLPWGIGKSFASTVLFRQKLPAAEHGAFAYLSPIDGKPRLYGYDAVTRYPLVIITGMDRSTALAAWYGRMWTTLAFLLLAALTVIFLAWRVARDALRQSNLIARLAASEARAEKSADYLTTILNAVGTPIWVLDGARRFVMLNRAFGHFVGQRPADLVGRPEQDALDRDGAAARDRHYQEVLGHANTSEAITEIRDGSGAIRTVIQLTSKLVDAGGNAQLVNVLTDITERQKAETRLAYIANFDPLTGLPNQSQFRRMLETELAAAGAAGRRLGVFVVSLERMHEISDLLGHEAGDLALEQVGELLRAQLARAAGVARIKGNEFAVLVRADGGRPVLEQFALDLQQRLAASLTLERREFYPGPLIGVAVFPEDGATADELFRRADSARNRVAAESGDTIRFFSQSTHTDLDERLAVEAQLRRALERKEFRLVYQPKVAIGSGRITGFEALLRWTSPLLGEVSPVRFIPIAERTGLIIPIGAWVLDQACRQMQQWSAHGGMPVKLAVNLSPRQFYQKDLLPMIRQCLERSAVAPGSLELELTETALMSREQEVDVLMREIRALGVGLSIDDFGTGYSSLAYLKRFPVQRLKIDRAFIHDLGKDEDSAGLVRSIIDLAHGLKLTVVAEGVETAGQLELLRAMACDEYQGFLFSRPVEADSVAALIERNKAAFA